MLVYQRVSIKMGGGWRRSDPETGGTNIKQTSNTRINGQSFCKKNTKDGDVVGPISNQQLVPSGYLT